MTEIRHGSRSAAVDIFKQMVEALLDGEKHCDIYYGISIDLLQLKCFTTKPSQVGYFLAHQLSMKSAIKEVVRSVGKLNGIREVDINFEDQTKKNVEVFQGFELYPKENIEETVSK